MSTVITVENLGKKYTLHHQQREKYIALRDVLTNGVKSLGKKLFSPFTIRHSQFTDSEDFWALKDVSFEVKQGDRIGIIGRNGAGKSTLLKILSRITEPTTGSVRIKGRVASLLEVGTGFHPELTGRENIFLNGAILGMGRAEIKKKFDEIVDFAEIEKFLDTPVKRYSSGMYVRLAFAVAAHLEPEILIVDEVLAVGDAQFQKKCLGKMEDVSAKEGRTVLFVSHNMGAVMNLCRRGIVLDEGTVTSDTNQSCAIESYYELSKEKTENVFVENGVASLQVKLIDENYIEKDAFVMGRPISFKSRIKVDKPIRSAAFGIGIETSAGQRVLTFHTKYQYNDRIDINAESEITFKWSKNVLCAGYYHIVAALYEGGIMIANWDNIASLTILESDYFQTGRLPDPSHQGHVFTDVCIEISSS